jgi:dTDP-4-amino-4,6-dideoxygalactose transaminase
VALANAVMACGATPLPVDVDSEWQMDFGHAETMLESHHPRACIVVNMFGAPAPVERTAGWPIPVIEDCAHAFGAELGHQALGARTAAAVLSFHATKLLAAGEGGAVLTSLAAVHDYVVSSRDYADKPADGRRQNDQITDIAAALALAQMNRLGEMLRARQRIADLYFDLLTEFAQSSGAFVLPSRSASRIWYRYVVDMRALPAREAVMRLAQLGVSAAEPVDCWVEEVTRYPVSCRAFQNLLSLPMYPTLTDTEQRQVVHALMRVCDEARRSAA